MSSLTQYSITSLTQLQSSINVLKIINMQQLAVPILNAKSTSKKTLSALPPGSKLGFPIRECVANTKRFEVSSIFLTVDSNDWKGCLHAKLKAPETGISTNIAVLRPIYARPVVHAQVDFQVKSDSGKLLSCSFVGFPLAFPVSHDYRMVLDCVGGVTLDDIGKTLGIDVLNSLVTSEAHLVAEIPSQVSVDRFNAAVIDNKQTGTFSGEDCLIDFW